MKELNTIQCELVAPKGRKDSSCRFSYRSLEDITEAVKPLLKKTGCTLTFTDDIVVRGDRYYVKATAIITNPAGEKETADGFAREPMTRKGMDDAQVTGSSSSYARKYAACSLLAIDDNMDPDMMDNRDRQTTQHQQQGAAVITKRMVKEGATADKVEWLTAFYDRATGTYRNDALDWLASNFQWEDGAYDLLIHAANDKLGL